ncbi:hypothetical protein ACLEEB_05830 [Lonsdalea quercina]|uniref:hypothetical protein n=1 Tax=Lonsdalea quercina TaxID=71657 RepID=UPI003976615F
MTTAVTPNIEKFYRYSRAKLMFNRHSRISFFQTGETSVYEIFQPTAHFKIRHDEDHRQFYSAHRF